MRLQDLPPSWSSRMGPLLVAASVGLAVGCFNATGSDDDVSEDETTDTSCDPGTLDCPCNEGMCDAGLMCEDDTCVEEDLSECGNGIVEGDEACDDGNDVNTDTCTTLCMPPSCEDGILSGFETDVDCGGDCEDGCDFADACLEDADCAFPNCNPDSLQCDPPLSCFHQQMVVPSTQTGVYWIDVDGSGPDSQYDPEQVECHTTKDGGGWTLVFTASDDDVDTWTWNNRAMMANEVGTVGDVNFPEIDYMAAAYHQLPFEDMLFIHQPSNVWAHYGAVSDGTMTVGEVVAGTASPNCDFNLAGNGFELVGGTLTANATLCDTDLYFNLGDHEGAIADCEDFGAPANTATFGPVWSSNFGDGCPFDDPAEVGVGPHGPCGACPAGFASMEFNGLGYAAALDLNTGTQGAGENYLQMYVR